MTIPLSPEISLSPSSFSASGQTIVASVSVPNRPTYHGKPSLTGLTAITPRIVCSRSPSGHLPFAIMVSATATTADGIEGDLARQHLHFEWDFGDSSGTELATDYFNGSSVNLNNSQQGAEAAYLYRNAGTYTITLTAKGKDENGNLITATATTLIVEGSHLIGLGKATGGTYTLTFNGNTTAAIAYNATTDQVIAALHLLPGLSSSNCYRTRCNSIIFTDDLLGTTYTFTGDFTGLTGTTDTPKIRTEYLSAEYNGVTVSDLSTWSSVYVDSTYVGGGNDGTISAPYTTMVEAETFCETASNNRIIYIKRGSTVGITSRFQLNNGASGRRIMAYGTGAKPIINISSAGQFYWGIGFSDRIDSDYLLSNLDIRQQSYDSSCRVLNGANGSTALYGSVSDIVFDNITWMSEMDGTLQSQFGENSVNTTSRGVQLTGYHVFNCDFDSADANNLGCMTTNMNKWTSIIGGSMGGGTGSLITNHHVYLKTAGHALVRYVRFFAGSKNFCINGDCDEDWTGVYDVTIDGCDITGAQNGIDLSNNPGTMAGYTGFFDGPVIQFNKIHSGQISSQQIGIYSMSPKSITIRYNDFWNNLQTHIALGGSSSPHDIRANFYGNRLKDGVIQVRHSQTWYCHNNVFDTQLDVSGGPGRCLEFYNQAASRISLWDCDGNTWYNPTNSNPFYDDNTSTDITFAAWQSAGNDVGGLVTNPMFHNPTSGQFIASPEIALQWPVSFTNLQYSLDGGDNWLSYTNESSEVIASYLTDRVSVLFRADSAGTSSQSISGTSNGASVDVGEETFASQLTYLEKTEYYLFKANGLYYAIKV